MHPIELIYVATGIILCAAVLAFAVSSYFEKKTKAFMVALIFTAAISAVWLAYYHIFSFSMIMLSIPPAFVITFAFLFFAPDGRISAIEIDNSGERVDERDVMFAREEYEPGDSRYDAYYSAKPEYKEIDDAIRELPRFLEPGGKYYDPIRSPYIDSIFHSVRYLTTRVDGEISPERKAIEPAEITETLKHAIMKMGADDVGIAPLRQEYVYSHVGRGPQKWGSEIFNNHKYAIMFALEMDYEHVESAPDLTITEESASKYLQGALISVEIARHIRNLGYSARAHIAGSNYQIMLPPVAYDAGLGEPGRLGYLISPRFGPRIRLGAVTTDLSLTTDKPKNFGVQDFCEKCLKCAVNCPSGAIPYKEKVSVRGVKKWQLNIEKCISYWRILGTDCGLCMKVCPYSHPPTLFHNIVRKGIGRSAFARGISIQADDLFYGRKARF
ncbi:MAG: 4Fe-4S dicluster domain-containing protein [Candidatus Zixiibacteriota bacterium]|nr:MAG: 4Fe-4S dicluster domain-containing protein [candidate division Zixibacteria bacterium]